MKITDLEVTNVKGIRHVHIVPTDDTVLITGANGQGKSSTLDAIWLGLAGRKAMAANPDPVHHGEETAEVRIALGDGKGELLVVRRWTAGGENTSLKVTNGEGLAYEKGQSALDNMLGAMTFDPLAWLKEPASAQRATLLSAVELPIDLDKLAEERKELFDQRTAVNREVGQMEARVAGMPEPPADTPDEETSLASVLEEIDRARARVDANEQRRRVATAAQQDVVRRRDEVARLKRELELAEEGLQRAMGESTALDEEVRSLPPEVDPETGESFVDILTAKASSLEATNAAVRAKATRSEAVAELTRVSREAEQLTEAIAAIDRRKRVALDEAKMPVDGLSVTDDDVLFNERPLKQCSTSEQLEVSVNVAMATNPVIRIVRIANGNDLDSAHLELISRLAEEKDFQLWIELVDETGDRGFYIEAGELAGDKEGERP